MAAGGYEADLSHSTLMGSEDGDLSHSIRHSMRHSIRMGSQDCYEYYCEPCDVDHYQVEATFYCNNCHEYMCRKCNMYHKKFKELKDHKILDVKYMTHKPPVSHNRPASHKPPVSHNRPASTRPVTMATHVKDIMVGDHIRSSALMSTNQLLVTDCAKNKVILVDTVSGRQVSELELTNQPHQVTKISDTESAVTLPGDKKIVLLRTQPKLSVDKEICVQGKYRGIAYMNNELIVTFEEGHVGILNMSGKVLRTISTDQTGMEIFRYPHYITVDPANGRMFVSDRNEFEMISSKGPCSKVVKLSKKGSVLATYTRFRDGCPNQVAVDSKGMIYVAWRDTGCVEQMSANCDNVKTIIPRQSSWPQALSYDEATKQLYVGRANGVLQVYKLS